MTARRFIFAFIFSSLGIILPSFYAHAAEEPEISVKAELNQAFITIGDPVEYAVTIRHDPSVQILSHIPPPAEDILKIKKIDDVRRKEGSRMVEGKKFTLTAFRLGQFVLDPIHIQYRSKSGSEVQTLKTNQLYLTVKSVAEGETKTDIRGVKTVMGIPQKIFSLILWTLLALAAVAGYLVYQQSKKKAAAAPLSETLLTPEEEALFQLNQLFDSDLLRRGKVKEYYLRLSEILRVYLEKRFHILAVESTTDEIRRLLKNQVLEAPLREKITEVLEAADLAKFAKWKPEPSEVTQINQRSKQIVEESRPKEAVSRGV